MLAVVARVDLWVAAYRLHVATHYAPAHGQLRACVNGDTRRTERYIASMIYDHVRRSSFYHPKVSGKWK